MKTYTTVFIDIDNITYELHNNKYMHSYALEMVEQMLKKGFKSLQNFELIALLGKNENYGKNFMLKNRLEFMKTVSKNSIGFTKGNSAYLEYLLKYFDRTKKEVLVVSGNYNILNAANLVGFDTCYFNMFTPNFLNVETTISIKKLEELKKYMVKPQFEKTNLTNLNVTSNYHYYIDSSLVNILKEKNISLQEYDSDKELFLNHNLDNKVPCAITMDLAFAKKVKEHGGITCFINNHYNDSIDYIADYESSIENLPKQLQKLMNK